MAAPAPEVDIPDSSVMVLVCNACLGTRWEVPTRMQVFVDGVPQTPEPVEGKVGEWHCGDCGHHKAQLISRDQHESRLAERKAAST